jgi:hypothetical protein
MGIDDFDTSALPPALPPSGDQWSDQADPWGETFTAVQINRPDFGLVVNAVAERLRILGWARERHVRGHLARKLPRRFHFLLNHPRLLRLSRWITPGDWWPEFRIADLTQAGPMTEGAAAVMARHWVIAHPNREGDASYEGLTVRYLDVNRLPAEIYGEGPCPDWAVGVLNLTRQPSGHGG